jgi:hypothetical protein
MLVSCIRQILLAITISLLLIVPAFGQTAQVTGRVTDSAGAVVPGAQVALTNQATGVSRDTVTNNEGYYTVPLLQPGVYRINVKKDGFKPVLQTDIRLQVEQVARLDFTLQAGAVTEAVSITSDAPILERETSSLGQVIENKIIVTLPLNGRNYSQLAVLMPGATPNSGSRATDGFSLNGNRTFQNKFLLDGVDNNNYILGVDTNSTQALRPSVDAIQEFKVESANYTAEHGQAAGGVVTVAIKSGTNDLHGSAFEFLRNDKLDANDWFANRARLNRPPLRYNQFGGTVGGPVWRNRTFYFGSYQGTRQRNSTTSLVTVPTTEQARGNFGSVNIYDPGNVTGGNRAQFPNNTIPDNRMDPVGRRIAALYPAPNQPGTVNNYASIVPQTDNGNQYDFRGDHNFSERDKLFGRISILDRRIQRGGICPAPGNCGVFATFPLDLTNDSWSLAFGETHVFSANGVNELRVGYSNNRNDQLSPVERSLYEEFGIKGVPAFEGLTGLPTFTVANYTGLGNRTFTPNPKKAELWQINDNFSWFRGAHTLKFGGEIWRLSTFAGTSNNARGSFNFSGQFTARTPGQGIGNAVADLLLGLTSQGSITTRQLGTFLVDYYSGYFNDSWKLSPKLTINLGLRYELQTRPREEQNRQAFFDYTPGSPTYGTVVLARDGGHRERTFSDLDRNNFAPRAGFAWQASQKTVVRGGFGIFYGGIGFFAIGVSGAANPPYFVNIAVNSATTAATTSLKLSDGFPANTLDPVRAVNPALYGQPQQFPYTEIYQGNLSIQRELPGGAVAQIAYVGSGTAKLRGQIDLNAPRPGTGAPQPRRLFSTFGAINIYGPFAHASYHSLQAKLERRFAGGFSLLSSYTWSHAIDNSTDGEDTGNGAIIPQDSLNTAAEKSSSGFDIRHRFVTSAIYDLPLGRSGGWLGGSKAARAIFGGFQIGGIVVAQTGQPVNPGVSGNPANTTNPVRPNRLADGALARGERSVDRWFDPAAFAVPAAFTYGSSGRNVIRAPGLVNLDFLIGRNFKITETVRLEFRSEFFNLTNSVHFSRPNATIGAPQAGRITNTAAPNRQVQFGLRLAF